MSKIVFEKNEIMAAVEKVIVATTEKSNIDILKNIVIRPVDGKIKIMASNLGVLFNKTVSPKSGAASGEDICVEGKLFFDALKRIQGEEITLEDESSHIITTSGEAKIQFQNYNSSDFPDSAFYKEEEYPGVFKIKYESIDKILKYVGFCIGNDDEKPMMKCINFSLDENKLTTAAVSGLQVAVFSVKVESTDVLNFNIPGDSFKLLPSLFRGCTKDIEVKIGTKFAVFTCENTQAFIKLNEGKFIDYVQIFPKSFMTSMTGKRQNFINSLELVTLVREKAGSRVTFNITTEASSKEQNLEEGQTSLNKRERVKVSTQNEVNTCSDIIKDIEIQGSDFVIQCNSVFFMSVLKAIDEENIRVLIGDSKTHPFVIQVEDYLNMFMPLSFTPTQQE